MPKASLLAWRALEHFRNGLVAGVPGPVGCSDQRGIYCHAMLECQHVGYVVGVQEWL
ncbi:hypothetical protein LPH50_06090 [Xylella taiwanensis]|uniref:Uncharacterized protein n=1 Tax=Xylella taiwanensis TaxID=1444770 RepID=Z9JIV8_9GAMM|nr:hypothetical protein [Xylella taiwanensis]EWS77687.1 hypothetical protein AF72_09675 [Xylella taiwanensis]MCD8455537.1 hypothetical protein [Xylella taiwanensis]MCD8457945.1 hypothetical protein [Xylella taiwanensis]MCD8460079.1 hypothetical protein [Xylella taiwanensis]MCD8463862.1 hypothetical protein [Xylella taiwanensis]